MVTSCFNILKDKIICIFINGKTLLPKEIGIFDGLSNNLGCHS